MNNKKELNINARFGTLKDYFDLLDKRLAEEPPTSLQRDLPILSGDFLTYADRDDHYWSGYFTSRPFYKHMDRTVQHYVRSADILHSLALWKAKHHDGVTGTGRDHVVIDYGKNDQKLFLKQQNIQITKCLECSAAIENSSLVINGAAAYLLGIQDPKEAELLKSNLEFFLDELPKQLKVEAGSSIILHNSLATERHEVVCLRVASVKSRIQQEGADPKQQIQPHVLFQQGQIQLQDDEYELCFEATVKPLGFERYSLVEGADSEHMAKVQVSSGIDKNVFPDAAILTTSDTVSISNGHLTASFDPTNGYLKSVQYANGKTSQVQMEFLHYGARQKQPNFVGSDSLSGAYLFLPDGPAKQLSTSGNAFVVMKGDVRHTLLLKGPKEALVYQQVHLDFNSEHLDIVNRVDVRSTSNFELSMRLKATDFTGQDEQFYTDLNGFQRTFYPMTTAAIVESNGQRLTLLGRQALGVASLEAGQVEVILDRRLMQDDDRGLVQGVTDNHQTESHFRLHIEKRRPQSTSEDSNRAGFLSTSALQSSHELNYPLTVMNGHFDSTTLSAIPRSWSPLKKALPCDTHLFALRTLSEPTVYSSTGQRSTKAKFEASLILERQGVECLVEEGKLSGCDKETSGKFQLADYFTFTSTSAKSTSLTGMYETEQQLTELKLSPMDLKSVKIEF
ncbi:Aman-2 [Aphelenchoides bicaudatus]|nr:Aman-2 [Aphelenchoides bicaudatus]